MEIYYWLVLPGIETNRINVFSDLLNKNAHTISPCQLTHKKSDTKCGFYEFQILILLTEQH